VLFPLLSRNGYLTIDDYGSWEGSKMATDEFFEKNGAAVKKINFDGGRLTFQKVR
jgi:hypothetical protein